MDAGRGRGKPGIGTSWIFVKNNNNRNKIVQKEYIKY
jgi:hypothetical protein